MLESFPFDFRNVTKNVKLRNSVTLIIHNAWPINLFQSLAFFEPCLIGLRNLVDFAHSSTRSQTPRFLFISSITAVQSWNYKNGAQVPETVIPDAGAAIGLGYGESKFVAEQVSTVLVNYFRLC